jgi:hypothetical protein
LILYAVYISAKGGTKLQKQIENDVITLEELKEIADYTVQKINNYPARLGKTVENYFDVLYPNEVEDYIRRREMNRMGGKSADKKHA